MNNFPSKIKLNGKGGGLAFASFMALYVLLSFLGQLLAEILFGNGTTAFIAVCSTFSTISLSLIVLIFTLFSNNDFLQAVPVKKFSPVYVLLALLLSVGMFLGLGFVNDAFATVLGRWGLNVSGISVPLENGFQLFLCVVLFAIFPAVSEELFFRGLLLNTLKSTHKILACLTVALCFAFYHCSATQFIYQFVYGFLLSLLALYSKSVIPCILAHFFNNFVVIIFEYFKININLYSPVALLVGINLLAIVCTAFYFIYKRQDKAVSVKGEISSFYLPYGILALAVCVSLLLGNLLV